MFPAVHPRVCGEHPPGSPGRFRAERSIPACAGNTDADGILGGQPGGPSPRVRGTRLAAGRESTPRRSIPACAGNTRPPWSGWNRQAVHPRVCGEHNHERPMHSRPARSIPACAGNTILEACGRQLQSGPSPRVRGTLTSSSAVNTRARSIPACAGNTMPRRCRKKHRPVHPRVCGEHLFSPSAWSDKNGPSPRVRGTPVVALSFAVIGRSIPACAGNTLSGPAFSPAVAWSIPACAGNTQCSTRYWSSPFGPSPRVRGTLFRWDLWWNPKRSIPACAGNTRPSSMRRGLCPVHPRVCGEHSSPRRKSPILSSVHPRVCGEHGVVAFPLETMVGPSPRVRGTRPAI